MRFMIFITLVLVTACNNYGSEYEMCGIVENDLQGIINGTVDKDYDCVVHLDSSQKKCSGVVIGEKTILTASHCVVNDFFIIKVNSDHIGVSRDIHKHPEKDLAILFTDKNLNLPIANLPEYSYEYYLDRLMIMVGYGDDYIDPEERSRKFGYVTISKKADYLKVKEYDSGACYGDSGGPLMYGSTVVGILSKVDLDKETRKCVIRNAYYVEVFEVLDWIYKKMEEKGE